jgi:hypothetical protein
VAIKELKKSINLPQEEKIKAFIDQGGSLSKKVLVQDDSCRLTLRIPQWLLNRVDEKRKQKVGKISRNHFILELIEKATKK